MEETRSVPAHCLHEATHTVRWRWWVASGSYAGSRRTWMGLLNYMPSILRYDFFSDLSLSPRPQVSKSSQYVLSNYILCIYPFILYFIELYSHHVYIFFIVLYTLYSHLSVLHLYPRFDSIMCGDSFRNFSIQLSVWLTSRFSARCPLQNVGSSGERGK